MATGDDAFIPQILDASFADNTRFKQDLNGIIRKIFEMLYGLEGRSGSTAVRDSLSVDGDLDVSGELTVGLTGPRIEGDHLIEVATDSQASSRGVLSKNFGFHIRGGAFVGYKARGTQEIPIAVKSGDWLSEFHARGHAGDNSNPFGTIGGGLIFAAVENWTSAAAGTQCFLALTSTGSTTTQLRYLFQNTGRLQLVGGSSGIQFGDTSFQNTAFIPESALIKNSANQTLTTGVSTALTFDTSVFDTSSFFTLGSPTRLTFPSTNAKYLMGGMISFAANATGRREAIIRLNGTTNLLSVRQQTLADAVAYRLAIPPVLYQATAGDYVELMALQSSGGDLDSQVVAEAPAFWVTRVA